MVSHTTTKIEYGISWSLNTLQMPYRTT
jgi:hypothetical protein